MPLVEKMPDTSKQHRDTVLVGRLYAFGISHTSTRLYDGFDVMLGAEIYHIAEREKCI